MPTIRHPKIQTLDNLNTQNLLIWSVIQAMHVSKNEGLMKQSNVLH